MQNKVVAILEARAGAHLGELIARRGAVPLLAPALEEQPDVDTRAIESMLAGRHADPLRVAIFQTGVGTRALFRAADELGCTAALQEMLAACLVVVRGPKPVGELNARGVAIGRRARTPFTTPMVLEALADVDLAGARVMVQRFGAENRELREGLQARGARVDELSTYRWALPRDLEPLRRLLTALAERRVDAVVFTSAVQIQNLQAVARMSGTAERLAELLNRCVVASVGPVCTRALESFGVHATIEASPPKLGPLVAALESALQVQSQV